MVDNERALLKRIRLKTSRKLNSLFVGEYHSAFKGYGLSFESVREYQYGDDIRNIDWNVSARMNHLFIKEYVEERELSIVLMVDLSASLDFGTAAQKRDVILTVVTLLVYLAQINGDRISVLLFTDSVEKFIRPKKGKRFVLTVLDEILKYKPSKRTTNIGGAIEFLLRVLKKRSVVFILSDFLDQGYMPKIKHLMKKHDVIPVCVSDPMEKDFGLLGLTEFVDLESGEPVLTDAVPEKGAVPVLRELDAIYLNTALPVEIPILHYFERRNRSRLTRGE